VYISKTEGIKFAKRTSFLSQDSHFFSFQKLQDKIDFNKMLNDDYLNHVDHIIVFGELCGGSYPNMPVIPNVQRIQKEVAYSNDVELLVFDVFLVDKDGYMLALNHKSMANFCNQYGLKYVPLLFTGTLDECLEWSHNHKADESELYKLFNMPKIDGNIREGHVIKPVVETKFLKNRLGIFKDKNEKFKEQKNTENNKPKPEYSVEYNNKINELESMLCVNRFNNVVSKFGEYTIKNFRDLMTLLYEDVLEDVDISMFSKIEQHNLRRELLSRTGKFLGDNKQELF